MARGVGTVSRSRHLPAHLPSHSFILAILSSACCGVHMQFVLVEDLLAKTMESLPQPDAASEPSSRVPSSLLPEDELLSVVGELPNDALPEGEYSVRSFEEVQQDLLEECATRRAKSVRRAALAAERRVAAEREQRERAVAADNFRAELCAHSQQVNDLLHGLAGYVDDWQVRERLPDTVEWEWFRAGWYARDPELQRIHHRSVRAHMGFRG